MVNKYSLYIHIPFCIRKCRYCDFYSKPVSRTEVRAYLFAMVTEYQRVVEQDNLQHAAVVTLYFGGGTPSLLDELDWEYLYKNLISYIHLAPDAEISIECNPESFTQAKARQWLAVGINRLSIGVQSLDDRMLRLLGRGHLADDAMRLLDDPVLDDFSSVGVDLMYGLPRQSVDSLDSTLHKVLSHPRVNHLSAYELTLDGNTPFSRHKKSLALPSETETLLMMDRVIDTAAKHGFNQYEVSNYARPGHECRHNCAYWDHSPYAGIGPSAHSYLPPIRRANSGEIREYLKVIEQGGLPVDFFETIDGPTLMREMIFLRLRLNSGLSDEAFFICTGFRFYSGERVAVLDRLLATGHIVHDESGWRLTRSGLHIADAIAIDLVS